MKKEMKNPIKDEKDISRVYRGGGWRGYPVIMRASYRINRDPTYRGSGIGFRIVRSKQ